MSTTVKIVATSERYAVLRHPLANKPAGFDAAGVSWPLDQFTFRLLQEGSIRKVGSDAPGDSNPEATTLDNIRRR